MFYRYITVIFLLLFFSANAQRQDVRFEHFGTNEGLSHSNVMCILQDSRGFMWFGTADGLNQYDGYSFTVYRNNPANKNTLSADYVNSIGEDKNHVLWMGTSGGGLNSFDYETKRFTAYRHNPADINTIGSDYINTVLVDHNGNIWIGHGGGLDKYDPTKKLFTHYRHNNNNGASLAEDNVYSLAEDRQGNIWVGTVSCGLDFLNVKKGVFTHYKRLGNTPQSLANNSIFCIYVDSLNQVWAGTDGGGLNMLNPHSGSFKSFKNKPADGNSLAADVVLSINDNNGKLWVGTENGGLSVFDPATEAFLNYSHDDVDNYSIGNNSVNAIYKDAKGNVWVGTFSSGVEFVNADNFNFTHYRHSLDPNSLSSNKVLCMVEDNDGYIWVGTDGGGLNKFNPATGTFTHYMHQNGNQNSICGNYVLDVENGSKKNLWIGTWGDGVTVYNPNNNTYRHFKNDPNDTTSLSNNNAWYIYEDRQKNIWVCTQAGGLNLYNATKNNFTHYRYNINDTTSLGNDIVYNIYEDRKKRFWVATQGGGLDLFNPATGKFKRYTHNSSENSISDDRVGTIFEDERGILWVATPKGLNSFNPETGAFKEYGTKSGLPGNLVFGIMEDAHKYLWISTNNGLSKFDRRNNTFLNFSTSDGLQGKEFKENAFCNSHNGVMYFGGNNGFNAFIPGLVKRIPFDPPLVFTGFRIFNKQVAVDPDGEDASALKKDISVSKAITISYKQSFISLQYASLNYTTSDKKRYQYKLEGFDDNWIDARTSRMATYTNLNPGTYTFRVRGLDNEGNWSRRELSLIITVTPPFWQTWWFRLLVVAAITAVIVAIFRVRLNNIKRHNEQLEKQVRERTKQLDDAVEQERLARHNEELARLDAERANRAKSVFLATMSHEIRTPLNGVIGMSSLLAETPLTAEQEDYASTIKSCGETLMSVINDVLDFSKIESGNMELEHNDFDLRNCIEEVLDVFAGNPAKSEIDLVYQVDYNVPSYLIGDVHRLRQVLMNLVGNAIKFTHKGEIFIGVELKPHTGTDSRLDLQFVVRDTGIGIPSDKLGRLFKAFSQVDSSTTRKYGGSGLGLVICQKLVELMGGEIRVESTPGAGTTFYFNIISYPSSQAQRKYVHFNNNEIEGKKVLVVDDNLTNRKILQAQLEQWKLKPVLASSGSEALGILAADGLFDLLITDMHMPGMDGIELGKRVKRIYNNLPIILLSSIGDEYSRKFTDVFNAVINKPIKQYALYKYVSQELKTKEKHKDILQNNIGDARQTGENFALHYPMQILVAEDNVINVKLVTHVLGKLGYNAVVAADGQEVLEKFVLNHFDMILMDVQMPEIDGLEATRIIRRQDAEQPIIIAMTANATREDREECLQAGMDDYISKPIQLTKLVETLEKWARQRKAEKAF